MCEYCNEDFDGYYRPLDKNAHVCIFDKPYEKILDINWYGHKMKINIRFCPMCRKGVKIMQIETKYNIGDKIWVVFEGNKVANVYNDEIQEIAIDKKDGIIYYIKNCEDIKESDIILYEEKDKLVQKIEELMKEIHDREEK